MGNKNYKILDGIVNTIGVVGILDYLENKSLVDKVDSMKPDEILTLEKNEFGEVVESLGRQRYVPGKTVGVIKVSCDVPSILYKVPNK